MLMFRWVGRFCFKAIALVVFLCAVYFLRELVHEAYDIRRGPMTEKDLEAKAPACPLLIAAVDDVLGGIRDPLPYAPNGFSRFIVSAFPKRLLPLDGFHPVVFIDLQHFIPLQGKGFSQELIMCGFGIGAGWQGVEFF